VISWHNAQEKISNGISSALYQHLYQKVRKKIIFLMFHGAYVLTKVGKLTR
jgi:hypothetical protein